MGTLLRIGETIVDLHRLIAWQERRTVASAKGAPPVYSNVTVRLYLADAPGVIELDFEESKIFLKNVAPTLSADDARGWPERVKTLHPPGEPEGS